MGQGGLQEWILEGFASEKGVPNGAKLGQFSNNAAYVVLVCFGKAPGIVLAGNVGVCWYLLGLRFESFSKNLELSISYNLSIKHLGKIKV